MPLFCRHNRHTVDCPICSKEALPATAARPARARKPARQPGPAVGKGSPHARKVSGLYAAAGPYEDLQVSRYEVRLERVPGGLRLAEWPLGTGELRRRAPVLVSGDLQGLIERAIERAVVGGAEAQKLSEAVTAAEGSGVSRGRAGEFWEELRVERLEADRIRVARWIERPGSGWERQETPVMLPAARFAEALRGAASGASAPARP
ncbi:MAG: hypothetical protein M3350_00550 [Actinomycetota bacterium]|nr:hypothetical protein [Actinomycetota bacterium]